MLLARYAIYRYSSTHTVYESKRLIPQQCALYLLCYQLVDKTYRYLLSTPTVRYMYLGRPLLTTVQLAGTLVVHVERQIERGWRQAGRQRGRQRAGGSSASRSHIPRLSKDGIDIPVISLLKRDKSDEKLPSEEERASDVAASRNSNGNLVWTCKVCTFDNDKPYAPVCEVCGTER